MLDPPYVLPQTSVLSPNSVGLSHAHPVRDIDATVELWLAEQGKLTTPEPHYCCFTESLQTLRRSLVTRQASR